MNGPHFSVPPPRFTMLDVLAGFHVWQQADPSNRAIHLNESGHTVEGHAILLREAGTYRIKFTMPFSPEMVVQAIEDTVAARRRNVKVDHLADIVALNTDPDLDLHATLAAIDNHE